MLTEHYRNSRATISHDGVNNSPDVKLDDSEALMETGSDSDSGDGPSHTIHLAHVKWRDSEDDWEMISRHVPLEFTADDSTATLRFRYKLKTKKSRTKDSNAKSIPFFISICPENITTLTRVANKVSSSIISLKISMKAHADLLCYKDIRYIDLKEESKGQLYPLRSLSSATELLMTVDSLDSRHEFSSQTIELFIQKFSPRNPSLVGNRRRDNNAFLYRFNNNILVNVGRKKEVAADLPPYRDIDYHPTSSECSFEDLATNLVLCKTNFNRKTSTKGVQR